MRHIILTTTIPLLFALLTGCGSLQHRNDIVQPVSQKPKEDEGEGRHFTYINVFDTNAHPNAAVASIANNGPFSVALVDEKGVFEFKLTPDTSTPKRKTWWPEGTRTGYRSVGIALFDEVRVLPGLHIISIKFERQTGGPIGARKQLLSSETKIEKVLTALPGHRYWIKGQLLENETKWTAQIVDEETEKRPTE